MLRGLRVGGPYTVVIDSDEFADQTINDVYLELGESASIERMLEAAAVRKTLLLLVLRLAAYLSVKLVR